MFPTARSRSGSGARGWPPALLLAGGSRAGLGGAALSAKHVPFPEHPLPRLPLGGTGEEEREMSKVQTLARSAPDAAFSSAAHGSPCVGSWHGGHGGGLESAAGGGRGERPGVSGGKQHLCSCWFSPPPCLGHREGAGGSAHPGVPRPAPSEHSCPTATQGAPTGDGKGPRREQRGKAHPCQNTQAPGAGG